MVDLLRLESAADVQWHHVGGTGDGGLDGIGVDASGEAIEVLQAKWHASDNLKRVEQSMLDIASSGRWRRIVIASMMGDAGYEPQDNKVEHWNLGEVAQRVRDYRDQLPISRSLGL